jgi:hypothetical protein
MEDKWSNSLIRLKKLLRNIAKLRGRSWKISFSGGLFQGKNIEGRVIRFKAGLTMKGRKLRKRDKELKTLVKK